MKLFLFFFFFFFIGRIITEDTIKIVENEEAATINEVPIETEKETEEDEDTIEERDFEKDIEELDISGFEDDIENIEELAYEDDGAYVTQMYVYIRIDEEYKNYMKHMNMIKLGEKYMTLLQSAMIESQLKITGVGMFTCYYSKKNQTENLVTYFLLQKEVDFLEVGFDKKYPEGRTEPYTTVAERKKLRDAIKNDEL